MYHFNIVNLWGSSLFAAFPFENEMKQSSFGLIHFLNLEKSSVNSWLYQDS